MSYFERLPGAIASSTKPWYAEPGSMKTNPIMIDHESSTKPELGSTKTNPIVVDDESGPAIKYGELLEELTYDTAWPAPSGQEADIPKALALSLDKCYCQEAERNYHRGTRANEGSSPLGSASNPMIHIDQVCSTNRHDSEAGTQITPDYLSLPYWPIDSPPLTFGSPACELVVRDAHSSELYMESHPKVFESDLSPSGSAPNPIVIHIETEADKYDSDADTVLMTSPQLWEIIKGSPSTARTETSQGAKIESPECEDLQKSDNHLDDQMIKAPSDLLQLGSSRDTMKEIEGANCKTESKENLHAEAPTTSETIVHGKSTPRSSRPPKHTSSPEAFPFELRRSKRLRRMT